MVTEGRLQSGVMNSHVRASSCISMRRRLCAVAADQTWPLLEAGYNKVSPAEPVQIIGTALWITPIIRTWAVATGMSQRMTHPVTVTITVQVTRLLTQGLQEVPTCHYRVPKSQDTFIY